MRAVASVYLLIEIVVSKPKRTIKKCKPKTLIFISLLINKINIDKTIKIIIILISIILLFISQPLFVCLDSGLGSGEVGATALGNIYFFNSRKFSKQQYYRDVSVNRRISVSFFSFRYRR